jgi:hypothetical protein
MEKPNITFAAFRAELLINPEIRIGIFSFSKEIGTRSSRDQKELEDNETLLRLPRRAVADPSGAQGQEPAPGRSTAARGEAQGQPREATVEGHGLIEALPTGSISIC